MLVAWLSRAVHITCPVAGWCEHPFSFVWMKAGSGQFSISFILCEMKRKMQHKTDTVLQN